MDSVICQTNSKWQVSNDLRTIRKEQGTRQRDFCVYKLLECKSFNIHFIPHPSREDRIQRPVFMLQNYPTQLKFIIQRSATKGIVKSVSIDWLIDIFHIYITRDEWFEINYFLSSLIYAQSKQYEYELTQKNNANREDTASITEWSRNTATDEPSINLNASLNSSTANLNAGGGNKPTTPSIRKNSLSKSEINHTGRGAIEEKKNKTDDENLNPDEENQHLTSGKNLFDSLSLCQPPRFQWNVKYYLFFF